MKEPETIKPEAMTLTQLALKYKVSAKTVKKWIKPFLPDIGVRNGTYLFTPAQIEIIYSKIGNP